MKNQEFINSLPKEIFCISWSKAIQMQYKEFRDPSDIDIILKPDYQGFAWYKATQFGWTTIDMWDEYQWPILDRIEFSDGSRVDIIINGFSVTTQINWFNVLPIWEVAQKKVEMMQYCSDPEDERYKKHLTDIGFLISRKLIQVSKI